MELTDLFRVLFFAALIAYYLALGVAKRRRQAAAKQQRPADAASPAPHPAKRQALNTERQPLSQPAANEPVFEIRETDPIREPESPKAEAETPEAAYPFDLRRAVIYSEILKPKFDPEED